MELVERDSELSTLGSLLSASAQGDGRVALVSGGLGSGKTALLHAFREQAAETGALVLIAVGARAERSLDLGIVEQLLTCAADLLGRDDLAALAATATDGSTGESAIREVCVALLELARRQPIVLAVDDVHFADSASLAALLYLRRRIQSARILMVLNEWSGWGAAHTLFRAEVTRQPHHHIRLPPLSRSAVHELAAAAIGEVTNQDIRQVLELSSGNPLLVHALIEDFRQHGVGDSPAYRTFASTVVACLHRWESGLLEVAQALAMLGGHATPRLIGQLIGTAPDEVARLTNVLAETGLLRAGRFRHSVVETAVRHNLGGAERAAMHLRTADILHQIGASVTDVAAHLMAADSADREWAVDVLRAAAAQTLAEDQVGAAVMMLELAQRFHRDANERVVLGCDLAKVTWRVNPAAAVRALRAVSVDLDGGTMAASDAITVLRPLLWQGDRAAATDYITRAMRVLGMSDPRALTELYVASALFFGRSAQAAWPPVLGDAGKANPWVQIALSLTDRSGSPSIEEMADTAEQVLHSCPLNDQTLEVVIFALIMLIQSGQPRRASAWCQSLITESVRRNAVTWQAFLHTVMAEASLCGGEIAKAKEQAHMALELLPAQRWGVFVGHPLSVLVLAMTAAEEFEEAAELLARPAPEGMFGTVFGHRYLHARGHYYLATDRVLAAAHDFQACGAMMTEADADDPMMVPWRADLAAAQLRRGRPKAALDLITHQLDEPRPLGPRTRGVSLRLLAEASELRKRPSILRTAIDTLQESGDRYQLAVTLAYLARCHRELGELGRARMTMRRALQEAKVCQVEVLVTRLQGPRPPTVSADGQNEKSYDGHVRLSSAEHRVAELAALGYTNREIGRKLHITTSTVEQHLTRVYRKLKLNSRKDLPSGLFL